MISATTWINKKFYGIEAYSPLTSGIVYIHITDNKEDLNDLKSRKVVTQLKLGITTKFEKVEESNLHFGLLHPDKSLTNIYRTWFDFDESLPLGAKGEEVLGRCKIVRLTIQIDKEEDSEQS